nr:hypothetical protein [Pseudomonadota bacterium]
VYDNDKVELRTDEKKEIGMIRDRKTMAVLHKDKKVFSATGLIPNHEISQEIPIENKIIMPLFNENGNLISPKDKETIRIIRDSFIAPKNLPLGSLAHSYTYLMEITKNINWTADPMIYFSNSNRQRLQNHLKKNGISLSIEFYNALDKFIECEDDPKTYQDSINFYLTVYETTCHSTPIEKDMFRNAIIDYFHMNHFPKELPERNTQSFT